MEHTRHMLRSQQAGCKCTRCTMIGSLTLVDHYLAHAQCKLRSCCILASHRSTESTNQDSVLEHFLRPCTPSNRRIVTRTLKSMSTGCTSSGNSWRRLKTLSPARRRTMDERTHTHAHERVADTVSGGRSVSVLEFRVVVVFGPPLLYWYWLYIPSSSLSPHTLHTRWRVPGLLPRASDL